MNEIKVGNSEFFIEDEQGKRLAEITFYNKDETTIVIDHTYVHEALRGQSIARMLVNKVVSFARQNNKKIIPECSYAYKILTSSEEFNDIIKKD